MFGFKNVQTSKRCHVSLKDVVLSQNDSNPIVAWQLAVCQDKVDARDTVIAYLHRAPVTSDVENCSNCEYESPSFSFEQISVSEMHSSMDKSETGTSGIDLTLNQHMSNETHSRIMLPLDIVKTTRLGCRVDQDCTETDSSVEIMRGDVLDLTKSHNFSNIDSDETYDPAMQSCAVSFNSAGLTSPLRRSLNLCSLLKTPGQMQRCNEPENGISSINNRLVEMRSPMESVSELNRSDEESMTDESILLFARGGNLSKQLQASGGASIMSDACGGNENIKPNTLTPPLISTSSTKNSEIMDEMPYSEDLDIFLADLEASKRQVKPYSDFHSRSLASKGTPVPRHCNLYANTEIRKPQGNIESGTLIAAIEEPEPTPSADTGSVPDDILEEMPYSEDLNAFLKDIDNSFSGANDLLVATESSEFETDLSNMPKNSKNCVSVNVLCASTEDNHKTNGDEKHTDSRDNGVETDCDKHNHVQLHNKHGASTGGVFSNHNKPNSSCVEEIPYSEDLDAFLENVEASLTQNKSVSFVSNENKSGDKSSTKIHSCNVVKSYHLTSNETANHHLSHVLLHVKNVESQHASCVEIQTKGAVESAATGVHSAKDDLNLDYRLQKAQSQPQDTDGAKTSYSKNKTGGQVQSDAETSHSMNNENKSHLLTDNDENESHKNQRNQSLPFLTDSISDDMCKERSFDCNVSGVIPITPKIVRGRPITKNGESQSKTILQQGLISQKNMDTPETMTVKILPEALDLMKMQRKQRRKSVNFAMHLLTSKTIPKIDVQMIQTPSPRASGVNKMKSCLKKVQHSKEKSDRTAVTKVVTNNADSEEMFTPSPLSVSVVRHSNLYQSTPNLFDSSASVYENSVVSSCGKNYSVHLLKADHNISAQLFTDESACDISSLSGAITLNLSLKKQKLTTVEKLRQPLLSDISNLSSHSNFSQHCDSNVSEDLFSDDESFEEKENICMKLFQ